MRFPWEPNLDRLMREREQQLQAATTPPTPPSPAAHTYQAWFKTRQPAQPSRREEE